MISEPGWTDLSPSSFITHLFHPSSFLSVSVSRLLSRPSLSCTLSRLFCPLSLRPAAAFISFFIPLRSKHPHMSLSVRLINQRYCLVLSPLSLFLFPSLSLSLSLISLLSCQLVCKRQTTSNSLVRLHVRRKRKQK